MAGEVRGKIYEAVTKVALEIALTGNRKGLGVLWHEQPDWISIEADLAVGTNKNDVVSLLLVTHSTSEGYSQKKFWRNMGEYLQWKVQGPLPVRTYGVVFDASIKKAITAVESVVLDGHLVVSDKAYGKTIAKYLTTHQKEFGSSGNKRAEHAEKLVDSVSNICDPVFESAINQFAQDLKALMKGHRIGMEKAWDLLRAIDNRTDIPKVAARNTYVRNGVS